MATDILLPQLSLTMTEGTIVEWKKNEGDSIHKGDTLFILETDKVTLGVEAGEDGTLTHILVPEGETVSIATVVACMEKPTS
jgi:pyruvate/2-oxoglutarate dehydrogenase complex dihydrolipoamide acyltransferase (E2) component